MSVRNHSFSRFTKLISFSACMLLCIVMGTLAEGQGFNTGSNGADGALDYSKFPPGNYVFDPSKFNPPLDPSGDNIFNFTTINIPAGYTVKLSGRILHGPVIWLTTGDVNIGGRVDLSGEDGAPQTFSLAYSQRALPGAGGFSGGVGGKCDTRSQSSQPVALPGDGPLGGAAGTCPSVSNAGSGGFSSNDSLIPLVGGSGGGGWTTASAAPVDTLPYGTGGGAGGGALLIASPTAIVVNGVIFANGGNVQQGSGGVGGSGSGGGIRLVAPAIGGSGFLQAVGGSCCPGNGYNTGANGFIRLDTYYDSFSNNFGGTPYAIGSTLSVSPPTIHPPSITVVSVDIVTLPQPPTGSAQNPDATIDTSSPVTVTIQAAYIPVGTVLTLHIMSDNDTEQTVQTTALAGTLASSTATATVTFPSGFSLNYVKGTWSQ